MQDSPNLLAGFIMLGVILALYMLPGLIAAARRHRNAGAIFALNLLLGWSVLGWIIALVWSISYSPPHPGTYPPATS